MTLLHSEPVYSYPAKNSKIRYRFIFVEIGFLEVHNKIGTLITR